MSAIGFAKHDHRTCVVQGVAGADAYCRENGLRLTPVRRRVLEILLKAHRAIGAYDVLDILRDEGLGSQPPQAYRALDFLIKQGFAHKIEHLNAFIACAHPRDTHTPVFLICSKCGRVAEASVEPASGFLAQLAEETGFAIDRSVVEAEGLCPDCRAANEK